MFKLNKYRTLCTKIKILKQMLSKHWIWQDITWKLYNTCTQESQFKDPTLGRDGNVNQRMVQYDKHNTYIYIYFFYILILQGYIPFYQKLIPGSDTSAFQTFEVNQFQVKSPCLRRPSHATTSTFKKGCYCTTQADIPQRHFIPFAKQCNVAQPFSTEH